MITLERALGVLCAAFLAASGHAQGQTASNRAAWMQHARWGVMVHYLADWKARDHNLQMNVRQWNELVDNFSVDGLAKQLETAGAGYLILTIGQNSGYYLAPNPTYDRLTGILPGNCSRRDLISDMSAALRSRGLKLIVYLPSGAPSGDRKSREALEWQNGPYPNREFQRRWEQVIRDWSLRWGEKIDGWWFDGCYWPNTMYRSNEQPNFESFAAAARAGNPRSAVAFNPGVVPRLISPTPHEDYTAGEISAPERLEIRRATNGILDGVQVHVLSYLGRTWGRGEPRFTAEQVVGWSRDVRGTGGVITWDTPVELDGRIGEPFMKQLRAVGMALNETRP
jgi:alpha-L-fucosidase